jgi:hypothetical protein
MIERVVLVEDDDDVFYGCSGGLIRGAGRLRQSRRQEAAGKQLLSAADYRMSDT